MDGYDVFALLVFIIIGVLLFIYTNPVIAIVVLIILILIFWIWKRNRNVIREIDVVKVSEIDLP